MLGFPERLCSLLVTQFFLPSQQCLLLTQQNQQDTKNDCGHTQELEV